MAVGPVADVRLAALLREFGDRVFEAVAEKGVDLPGSLRPGARVQGEIVGQLGGGRSLIDVEGMLFSVRLPANAAGSGTTKLPLVVLRGAPSPAFGLAAPSSATDTASARVAVSTLAVELQSFARAGTRNGEAGPLVETRPLLGAGPGSADELAGPLRLAIERSGLFYESHQAEWVGGRRELAALKDEPQARLAASAAGPSGEAAASAVGEPGVELPPGGGRAAPSGSDAAPRPAETAGPGSAGAATIGAIVDRQLQTFSTQQIHWSGQVWSGQHMDWVIEEGSSGDPDDDSGTPRWTSRLRLELPRIGALDAVVRLQGDHLQVDVIVPPERVSEIRDAIPVLGAGLSARGLTLARIHVGPAEPA